MIFQQNNLKLETSPYLRQHENNPVWWQSWNDDVLSYAKDINKPLLISIGYSACHWCHVMENQSFEDEEVAKLMNNHFVCIKIDREERPDLDSLYMNVVQLIYQSGGWPLNVFAYPDGRPFYGCTYYPKEQWIELLSNIQQMYFYNSKKTKEYAESIASGLSKMETIELQTSSIFDKEKINNAFTFWSQQFDDEWGGFSKAPKFMLPNSWSTILCYGYLTDNERFITQTEITLDRMAFGGIYDQLKGGFSRYSVDSYWKVPHFEKMLYDNAQLLSLYSNSYKVLKETTYKTIVQETIQWLRDEMLSDEDVFYSSIDADSEGVEGKYYTWTSTKLKNILKEDYELFEKYYNVDKFGKWEGDTNILIRLIDDKEFCKENNVTPNDFEIKVDSWKKQLVNIREKRIRPHRDEKILTSWNALAIIGLCDSYQAFGDLAYLDLAKNAMKFILETQWNDHILYRNYKDKRTTIPGFLDDYAITIEALIKLFETTAGLYYIEIANKMTEEVFNQFFNYKNKMFAYKSHYNTPLVNETFEIFDNVISSANSIMANNLYKLGKILSNEKYIENAKQMLANVQEKIFNHPSGFANWITLYTYFSHTFKEVVIIGNESKKYLEVLQPYFIPNTIVIATEEESLEITKNRFVKGKTLIYICENNTCKLPISDIDEAIKLLI